MGALVDHLAVENNAPTDATMPLIRTLSKLATQSTRPVSSPAHCLPTLWLPQRPRSFSSKRASLFFPKTPIHY